jgi:WD40 repeat protein
MTTATPEGFRADGTLYYIFDGDAIVELAADGTFEDLLPLPHIGQAISDLVLSPDNQLLAYIAPGAGSAREIYVTDRAGQNTRPVTSLGFSELQRPVWYPDGQSLAFIASQSPEAPDGIYHARINDGGQALVVQLPTTELRDLAWNLDGSRLFFSDGTIFAYDLATQQLSASLGILSGFGPDFGLVQSPTEPILYYFKPGSNFGTGERGGVLNSIDSGGELSDVFERPGAALYADVMAYSPSGEFLVISRDEGVWVQTQDLQTASKILQDLPVAPQPVFSPDDERLAYVGLDAQGVQQIFVIDRRGGDSTQLTFHQDGTVSAIVWASG